MPFRVFNTVATGSEELQRWLNEHENQGELLSLIPRPENYASRDVTFLAIYKYQEEIQEPVHTQEELKIQEYNSKASWQK